MTHNKGTVAFCESEKLGRCELLKIEVDGARARLGLRHAGAGDEAKEANGRGLHLTSAGGLGVGGEREGSDVE